MPPWTPGGIPIYCDLFALRAPPGPAKRSFSMATSPVWLVPDTCDLSHMTAEAREGLECWQIGGQPVVPVAAAFGGWGMYRAELFRDQQGAGAAPAGNDGSNGSSSSGGGIGPGGVSWSGGEHGSTLAGAPHGAAAAEGHGPAWRRACRHRGDGCEHLAVSECIGGLHGGIQVIATGLVIDWEGCGAQPAAAAPAAEPGALPAAGPGAVPGAMPVATVAPAAMPAAAAPGAEVGAPRWRRRMYNGQRQ